MSVWLTCLKFWIGKITRRHAVDLLFKFHGAVVRVKECLPQRKTKKSGTPAEKMGGGLASIPICYKNKCNKILLSILRFYGPNHVTRGKYSYSYMYTCFEYIHFSFQQTYINFVFKILVCNLWKLNTQKIFEITILPIKIL